MIRKAHILIGSLGLLLFVLSGQYMEHIARVSQFSDAERLLWRSSHIYFLLPGIANVFAGFYMPTGPLGKARALASSLLIASTFVLGLSFMLEPALNKLDRPLAAIGLYAAFAAAALVILNAGADRWLRRQK